MKDTSFSTIHKVSEWVDKGAITSTSAVYGYYGFNFTLNDLADVTSYTATYDQYRISLVECFFKPCTQPSVAAGSQYAFLHIATDYDDSTAPSTPGQLLSYANCTILSPGESHARSFQPHVALAAYSGAFTSYANDKNRWIDAASPSVQHYGLKCTVTQSTSTNVQTWYLYVRYHVELKNQR